VTEADWLHCEDPLAMLAFIHRQATSHKMRLFAVDTCRRCWHLLADRRYRPAVDVAESFADRLAHATKLIRVHGAASRLAVLAASASMLGVHRAAQ
jgi:hypothetical protein